MKFLTALCVAISISLIAATPQEGSKEKLLKEQARKLHFSLLTLDSHCDTPLHMREKWDIGLRHDPGKPESGCLDLIRMKEGGLAASFFAVFLDQGPTTEAGYANAKTTALHCLDNLDRMFAQHKSLCERALTPADARRIHLSGKRAIFIGIENGYPLGRDLANVDYFFNRGVRYITLSHVANNEICAASTDESKQKDFGLTEFGQKLVQRMNALGVMVDVSHISDKSFTDVIKCTKAPVIASHSNARAVCNHPRNLTDEQLLAVKKNKGVVQLCILGDYIKKANPSSERAQAEKALERKVESLGGWRNIKEKKVMESIGAEWGALGVKFRHELPGIKEAVDHIDHIVKVAGIDHVGIGTDFDGGGALSDCYDVTHLPGFTEELLRRGYSEKDIAKIWSGNFLRVMEEVQKLAVKK